MTLIVCLDDALGMRFNHRRQSRDRLLIADLLAEIGESRLFISPYTAELFPELPKSCTVTEHPLSAAGEDDYCFVEDDDPTPFREKITGLIIYRWNRLYPADVRFDLDMTPFRLIRSTALRGSSHDNITKEIWKT